jgi:hypothetical protein
MFEKAQDLIPHSLAAANNLALTRFYTNDLGLFRLFVCLFVSFVCFVCLFRLFVSFVCFVCLFRLFVSFVLLIRAAQSIVALEQLVRGNTSNAHESTVYNLCWLYEALSERAEPKKRQLFDYLSSVGADETLDISCFRFAEKK